MENRHHTTQGEKQPPLHWRSCKLIIDPVLTNGFFKVFRYDGQHFNMPVQDLGVFPVDTVRDPRISHLWAKHKTTDLSVPKFKIDECYVGPIPPKEVTFARLNDNVREGFLTDMCKKYGQIEEVEILYNPKNKKHLGIAKVIFDTVKAAKDTVQHLHGTPVMGNIIHVELDPRGDNRMRYFQLLISGLYTPQTLPVGIDELTLQSLTDSLLDSSSKKGLNERFSSFTGCISSPSSIATPLSLDTAYSSIWQDTPGSFGQTPLSQGTPRTPCLSGTPLSQDSCYSSLQTTPVHQISHGDSSSHGVHRQSRNDVCYRQPGRHYGRFQRGSQLSSLLTLLQPPSPLPLPRPQTRHAGNSHDGALLWCQDHSITEPGPHLATPHQESTMEPSLYSESLSLGGGSDRALIIAPIPVGQRTETPPPDHQHHVCVTDPLPSPSDTPPGNPSPTTGSHSLDTRIEMLLRRNQGPGLHLLGDQDVRAVKDPQDSSVRHRSSENDPASVFSPGRAPRFLDGSPVNSPQPTTNYLEDISLTPLPNLEEDALAPVLRSSGTLPLTLNETGHADRITSDEKERRLCTLPLPRGLNSSSEEISRPPPPVPFFNGHIPVPAIQPQSSALPANSLTPIMSFNPPIQIPSYNPHPPVPPPILPFPVPLPDGTIPIPPPGFLQVPGPGTPLPPPPIPPPPPLLRVPPPLVIPPPLLPPGYPPLFSVRRSDAVTYPPRHGNVSFHAPPWPMSLIPRFDPSVPPPGYLPPKKEDLHKVTVHKVWSVIMEELKSTMAKDLMRKMVEGVAFRAFDEWWDSQEQKAKTVMTPVKSREVRAEETNKPRDPPRRTPGLRRGAHLPSFKVKRKKPCDPATTEDRGAGLPDAVNHGHGDAESEPGSDQVASIVSREVGGGGRGSAARRRHARPLELDSEGEAEDQEREEEGRTENQETRTKDDNRTALGDFHNAQGDEPRDEEEKEKAVVDEGECGAGGEKNPQEEGAKMSQPESCTSSEESEFSSDSSGSYSSEDSEEDPSDYDSSSDEEEDEEGAWERGRDEYVLISSDEESMELEPPSTPTAPLTPGTELEPELALLDRSEEGPGERRHAVFLDGALLGHAISPGLPDPGMELLPGEHHLQTPSPIGLPVADPDFEVEMESPDWTLGSPANLRPLTPTGSLVDSDPDLLFNSKPVNHPAVVEVELPHTPGPGSASLLDSEDSIDQLLSLADCDPLPQRHAYEPPAMAPYPAYGDTPRTPGADERSVWNPHSSMRVPKTPGREAAPSEGSLGMSPPPRSPFPLPSSSSSLYIRTPRTPGRDFTPRRRTHGQFQTRGTRRSPTSNTPFSSPPCDERLTPSPVSGSSPCSLSRSSAESPRLTGAWPNSGARTQTPLQGLENKPELMDGIETETLSQRRRRRRRWRRMRSRPRGTPPPPGAGPSLRRRPPGEERSIVHRVWREGMDEEDARLLQALYERLLRKDDGFSWLTDTLWVPHPCTRVQTEELEERGDWMQQHVTGSARSEGFYKISQEDKINNRLTTEPPPTNGQGVSIPVQLQPSARAGSEFRSEQRRLLSSFGCDGDLVKFNQLKFRKKRIRFCRSHIHDWGLFALEPIAAEEMVIEYVGQTIRQLIADMREKCYEGEGIGSSYLFRVDQDNIIDATKCGNLARFINHSCSPNCYAKIITVESQKKIVIYSRQPIGVNEEITYDYKFPIEDEKIPCLCGADNCRGSLN